MNTNSMTPPAEVSINKAHSLVTSPNSPNGKRNALRRRLFLPEYLRPETREERIICKGSDVLNWISSYNAKTGWTVTWLDLFGACKQVERVMVIKRYHSTLGKFITFKIYR